MGVIGLIAFFSGERSHEEAMGEHSREVARQEEQEAERQREEREDASRHDGEKRETNHA